MNKIKILILGQCFITITVTSVRADIDPIFARLKPYRTYFSITKVDRFAEQFRVRIQETYNRFSGCVAINSEEEAEALVKENMGCPPNDVAPPEMLPVPPEKKDLALAIEKRMKEIFPKLTKFSIGYFGNYRAINVLSTTLLAENNNAKNTLVHQASFQARHIRDTNRLDVVQKQAGFIGGSTYLCFENQPEYYVHYYHFCKTLSQFIDYQLPAKLEGSSLYYGLFEKQKVYRDALVGFSEAVIQTADAIANGSYENPIEKILATQGTDDLPNGIEPYFEFSSMVGNRAPLRFSLKEAAKGPATVKGESGIYHYVLTLDTKNMTMDVRAKSAHPKYPGGQTQVRLVGHSFRGEDGLVVPDGDWDFENANALPDYLDYVRIRVAPVSAILESELGETL